MAEPVRGGLRPGRPGGPTSSDPVAARARATRHRHTPPLSPIKEPGTRRRTGQRQDNHARLTDTIIFGGPDTAGMITRIYAVDPGSGRGELGRNMLRAAMKARIFDMMFSAKGIGADG